jgi:hypothetical protein
MSIKMQGLWLIKVKARNASFAQEFKIEGAVSGNGVYAGNTTTPEVFVTGDNWSVTILNNPGTGFVPSDMQIKFPVSDGSFYKFDIESNDSGGDIDFNDLVLTCRTPVDPNDYIIYGNVSYYYGNCVFNPCNRRYVVIDTLASLKTALLNPGLKELVASLYPERLKELQRVGLNPQPLPPDPGDPFTPMVLPVAGNTAIPVKERFSVLSKPDVLKGESGDKKERGEDISFNRLLSVKKITNTTAILNPSPLKIDSKINRLIDKYFLFCESGSLPNAILRFQEYDRSADELSGAPYTGHGTREFRGESFADRNGNYIFRFRMSAFDVLDEINTDTATGEINNEQAAPDMIVQLMCPGSTIPVFETAPQWNIGHLRRLNICVPKEKSCLIPLICEGQHIIQGIGNIVLGPQVGSTRIGSSNYLNSIGIITASGSGAPQVRCAGWSGVLQLRGCMKNTQVKFYRLFSRPNTSGSSFTPFTQAFSLPRYDGINVIDQPVFDPVADAYINAETDTTYAWLDAYENIKARINTGAFASGSYIFRILGLDSARNPVPGADESVTLYLENGPVLSRIDPLISMDGVGPLGECALFTLPTVNEVPVENPGLTVRFKAVHNPPPTTHVVGFMNSYALSMAKGSGGFDITPDAIDAVFTSAGVLNTTVNSGRRYVHTDNLNCITYFQGTINETTADADGYYTVTIRPQAGGWLEPGQPFCAFGIYLGGNLRLTNGEGGYPDFSGGGVLIGIQRPLP